jgi:Asp-tRNA(Asn)/Glu-tRNA(Gln) amidotransferase A subunit family amidase
MPKERGRVPPSKEEEPQPYSLAARYLDELSSEQPYQEAQQTIFENEQLELSTYRLQLRRLDTPHYDWHVAIVGKQPPQEFDTQFRRILSTGEPVTLASEVLAYLLQRRAEASKLGTWVEGHYKPGKRRRLR